VLPPGGRTDIVTNETTKPLGRKEYIHGTIPLWIVVPQSGEGGCRIGYSNMGLHKKRPDTKVK